MVEDDSPESDFFDDLFDTANSESLPVDEMDQCLNSTVNDGNTHLLAEQRRDLAQAKPVCKVDSFGPGY